jgi:hypothetical protein
MLYLLRLMMWYSGPHFVANVIVSTARINEQPHLVPKLYKAFEFDRKYKHYLNIMMFCDSLKRQEKWYAIKCII